MNITYLARTEDTITTPHRLCSPCSPITSCIFNANFKYFNTVNNNANMSIKDIINSNLSISLIHYNLINNKLNCENNNSTNAFELPHAFEIPQNIYGKYIIQLLCTQKTTNFEGYCYGILELEKINNEQLSLRFSTECMILYLYNIINNNMNNNELNKPYKLSIKSSNVICIHLFNGLIGICNQAIKMHLFDIINNKNYMLPLTNSRLCAASNDYVNNVKLIQSFNVQSNLPPTTNTISIHLINYDTLIKTASKGIMW